MRERERDSGRTEGFEDVYVGTYYSEESRGIYRLSFDSRNGRLMEPELFYQAPNAKWVCLEGNSMVFPVEREKGAGVCFLELKEGRPVREEEILQERQTPCYILHRGREVYTANYHEGNVMVYHLEEGKPSLVERIDSGEGAGCHQVLLHEELLLVPCLEQNRIRLFDRGQGFGPVGEITFPEGSGPRHGVFNRAHTRFYVVSEWSNQLFVFGVGGREFSHLQTLPLLPEGWRGEGGASAAALRLTRDQRFLYVSVRGADLLCAFDVGGGEAVLIQRAPCGGSHPRDFILSRDEKFLLVANRFAGGIVSIERDRDKGLLGAPAHGVKMPQGVALALSHNTQEV